MTDLAKHRTLDFIASALRNIALWRGWTGTDRILLAGMADQADEMGRRYTARHTILKRSEGSRHVR